MFPLAGRLQVWHLEPLSSAALNWYFSSTLSLTPHRHPMLKSFFFFLSLDLSARLNRDKGTGNDRIETEFGDLGRKK